MTRSHINEFPDFDSGMTAALLTGAGFADASWHNNTCPSFSVGNRELFVDYMVREHREFPNWNGTYTVAGVTADGDYDDDTWQRFQTLPEALAAIAVAQLGCDPFEEARTPFEVARLLAATALAKRFADGLREDFSDGQWNAMRERNRTNGAGVCASHDFCDANMVMNDAFTEATGRSILPENDEEMTEDDCRLWNAAWAIAKHNHLTAA